MSQRFGHRLGAGLVTAQVVGTTALLYLTGLAVHSLQRVSETDLGIDAGHVVTVDVPALAGLPIGPERFRRLEEARQKVAAVRGVVSTARALQIPLSGRSPLRGTARVLGDTGDPPVSVRVNYVSRDFVEAIGAAMVSGDRLSDSSDANVALVNETLARLFGAEGAIVGRTLQVTATRARVIGVVRDIVDVTPNLPPDPQAYFLDSEEAGLAGTLIARVSGDAAALVPDLRGAMGSQSAAGVRVGLLRDAERAATSAYRGRGALLGWMALTGILIAAIGLGGSLMLTVVQRTREIGLRMALGAERRSTERGC